jgi:transcriptional regulator with XRE-family HTH domain
MTALPPQDELRRRLRAARVLADVTFAELAARLDPDAQLGERVLRRLEAGEARLRAPQLRELANALGLPFYFFEVENLADCFRPADRQAAEWADRLAALEARQARFEQELRERDSGNGDQQTPSGSQPSSSRRGPRGTSPRPKP